MKRTAILLYLLLLALALPCKGLDPGWQKTMRFEDSPNFKPTAVVSRADGSAVVIGAVTAGGTAPVVGRFAYASNGQRLWARIGSSESGRAGKAAVFEDGSFVVVTALHVLRFDANGVEQWKWRRRRLAEENYSWPVGAHVLPSSDVVVAWSTGHVARLTADGQPLWIATIEPMLSADVSDDGVVMTCSMRTPLVIQRVSPTGALLNDIETLVERGSCAGGADGSVYVAGAERDANGVVGFSPVVVSKYGYDGEIGWVRTVEGNSLRGEQAVFTTGEGGILLAVYGGAATRRILSLDSTGQIEWSYEAELPPEISPFLLKALVSRPSGGVVAIWSGYEKASVRTIDAHGGLIGETTEAVFSDVAPPFAGIALSDAGAMVAFASGRLRQDPRSACCGLFSSDAVLMHLDTQGAASWRGDEGIHPVPGNSCRGCSAVTANGDILTLSHADPVRGGLDPQVRLSRTRANGEQVWETRLTDLSGDFWARGAQLVVADQRIYMFGNSPEDAPPSLLVALDDHGTELWRKPIRSGVRYDTTNPNQRLIAASRFGIAIAAIDEKDSFGVRRFDPAGNAVGSFLDCDILSDGIHLTDAGRVACWGSRRLHSDCWDCGVFMLFDADGTVMSEIELGRVTIPMLAATAATGATFLMFEKYRDTELPAISTVRISEDGVKEWELPFEPNGGRVVPHDLRALPTGAVAAWEDRSHHFVSRLEADGRLAWSRRLPSCPRCRLMLAADHSSIVVQQYGEWSSWAPRSIGLSRLDLGGKMAWSRPWEATGAVLDDGIWFGITAGRIASVHSRITDDHLVELQLAATAVVLPVFASGFD
jgi:hypothetical protein